MKTLFAAGLVAGALANFGGANAMEGCCPGFHRGAGGRCVINRGTIIVASATFYDRCPTVSAPRRPCPYGFVWRYKACFPN